MSTWQGTIARLDTESTDHRILRRSTSFIFDLDYPVPVSVDMPDQGLVMVGYVKNAWHEDEYSPGGLLPLISATGELDDDLLAALNRDLAQAYADGKEIACGIRIGGHGQPEITGGSGADVLEVGGDWQLIGLSLHYPHGSVWDGVHIVKVPVEPTIADVVAQVEDEQAEEAR